VLVHVFANFATVAARPALLGDLRPVGRLDRLMPDPREQAAFTASS
jgi:hypothetical protein